MDQGRGGVPEAVDEGQETGFSRHAQQGSSMNLWFWPLIQERASSDQSKLQHRQGRWAQNPTLAEELLATNRFWKGGS